MSLGILAILAASLVACAAPEANPPAPVPEASLPASPERTPAVPSPPQSAPVEEVFSALDAEALLNIGYNDPDRVVAVEGVVVRTYYAKTSKGKPTFLDFHDPYQDWFKCVIWEEDRENSWRLSRLARRPIFWAGRCR